jgi:integrase/recombinase XerD
MLGHRKLQTTSIYTHVATKLLREVISPLQTLPPPPYAPEPPEFT